MKYIRKSRNYIHRKIAGSDVLIAVGENIAKFNGYIELNSTASFIWDDLAEAKSIDELKEDLMKEFGVDEAMALNDLKDFIDILIKNEMVDSNE